LRCDEVRAMGMTPNLTTQRPLTKEKMGLDQPSIGLE
jgi:hypothetical protein